LSQLRVHIVTEDDPLYVVRFFETFLAEYPQDDVEIVGITIAAAFRESKLATARRLLPVYGLVGTCRLGARFAFTKLRHRSVASLARQHAIPLLPTSSVNEPSYVAAVRSLQPDVIVSVAAPEIFGPELLASARLMCVNLHSGRLPEYRGMMPTFWQMLAGESHATVTVHEMAAQVDAGAVLDTERCSIHPRDSLDRVMTEAKVVGARLVVRVLGELAHGKLRGQGLDMTRASYYGFPGRSDARALRALGHRLL
jgi:methionyl-tRNA formyltransferase